MWCLARQAARLARYRALTWLVWMLASGLAFCLHQVGITRWYVCRNHLPGTAILYYHQIATHAFRRHIEYLRKHYNLIRLDDLVESIAKGTTLKDAVVITFDDGYKSIYSDIFPILKRYKVPVTVFLVSDIVGTEKEIWADTIRNLGKNSGKNSHIPDVAYLKCLPDRERNRRIQELIASYKYTPSQRSMLSWNEAQEMLDSGLVSFGSHSKTHPCLTMMDAEEAKVEILNSKRELESHLNIESKHFSYPNGDYDSSHIKMLEGAYQSASTIVPGINDATTSPYELRRIAGSGNVGVLAMKISGLWGRLGMDWFTLEYMRKRALLKPSNQEISRDAKRL